MPSFAARLVASSNVGSGTEIAVFAANDRPAGAWHAGRSEAFAVSKGGGGQSQRLS
jgi:hypothetical protein